MTRTQPARGIVHRFAVAGGDIGFRIDGNPAGPWVIASHSLASSHRMWDAQIAALADSFNVLRLDLRGHGASTSVARAGSIEQCVNDVIALMHHLQIDAAHFLGLSLGGAIGLALSIRRPDQVRSVIACCCRVDAPAPYADAWSERIALAECEGMAALVEPTLARWFTPDAHIEPAMAAAIDAARAQFLATPVAGYRYGIETLLSLDETDGLASIRTPVLLIAGNADTAVPPAVMAAMHMRIPGSRFEILEAAAHLCNVERADRFDELMLKWLHQPQ